MIIDFHTHTFPEKIAAQTVESLTQRSGTQAALDGTVGCLSKNLKRTGIDLAIVLPVVTNPLKTEKINSVAALVNENTATTGIFSFGGIHPDTPDYKTELKKVAAWGLKGIKLHPAYQQVPLDDIRYKRIIAYADELNLIISVHGGIDIGIAGDWSDPWRARKVLDEVKPKKLIMAHMGAWQLWEESKKYLCGQNVYLDTAFSCSSIPYKTNVPMQERLNNLSRENFLEMLRLHGADKILFGTDSPWDEQAKQLDFIKNLPISQKEKEKVLGENGKKLLNL